MINWKSRILKSRPKRIISCKILTVFLLLAHAEAASLTRSDLMQGFSNSEKITLAQGQLELARNRLDRVKGIQITASSTGDVSRAGSQNNTVTNLSATLRAVYPGNTSLLNLHLPQLHVVKRAELNVQQAVLNEWIFRIVAWNDLAAAQSSMAVASVLYQSAVLTEQIVQARIAHNAATDLQLQSAKLDRERAELVVTQTQNSLALARNALMTLGVAKADSTAEVWAALPLPPRGVQGLRSDVLEADLAVMQAENDLEQARQTAQPTFRAQGQFTQGRVTATGSIDRHLAADVSLSINLHDRGGAPAWNLSLMTALNLDGAARLSVVEAEKNLKLTLDIRGHTLLQAAREQLAKAGDVETAKQSLFLAEQDLKFQEINESVVLRRHELGLVTQLEMLQARATKLKAIQVLWEMRRKLDNETLNLWTATGWSPVL